MYTKNAQTIIQNTISLRNYDFEILNRSTVELIHEKFNDFMTDKSNFSNIGITLKLFECYLQITNQRFQLQETFDLGFNDLIVSFIGALWSDTFLSGTDRARYKFTHLFIKIINSIKNIIPLFFIPKISPKNIRENLYIKNYIEKFNNIALINEKIFYWKGWWSYDKLNDPWFIPLNGIYKCYGPQFTEKLFFQLNLANSNGVGGWKPYVSDFLRWLPFSGYTIEKFDDPISVHNLFRDCLKAYLTNKHKENEDISIQQLIIYFRRLTAFVEKYLLGIIFAEPFGKLILPHPTAIKGRERRIKRTADGIEVKEKLLTEIPLQITDEQAIELLFSVINEDFNHVVSVSEKLSSDLWRRYQRRKTLAKNGVVRPERYTTSMHDNDWKFIIHKNNPEYLSNIAATFEFFGFQYNKNKRPIIRPYPPASIFLTDAAFDLGLPTSYVLLPYMALLVAEHPNIVPSFLTDFELYNKHGKLTGFIKLDGGYILDGRKKRRGPEHAQQIISLTKKSTLLVKKIIEITDCVRTHLKKIGDNNWRYLFLTCGNGFSPSKMESQYHHAKRSKNTIYQELSKQANKMHSDRTEKISDNFNLSALRASKAVLIYLQSRSVKAMSDALGHKEYNSKTLSHYLPDPILDFFQTRWIRIFQQGLIVEAMKDSPHLLIATKFSSMSDFHEFMKNHALKKFPPHLEDPGSNDTVSLDIDSEIIFSINSAILSLLLSLQKAVFNSKKRVCGIAAYWNEVATHIVKYIENTTGNVKGDEFKSYLNEARLHVNSEKMESIIYA